jgi:hypothetical protein
MVGSGLTGSSRHRAGRGLTRSRPPFSNPLRPLLRTASHRPYPGLR